MKDTQSLQPLFQRFPMLAESLAFTELGTLPTAVEPLTELGAELNVPALFVKRDDVSAATYGGNKIRKLEFLLADAQNKGCHTVLTFGGLGSNHALATSICCQQLGLQCVAVLTPEPATDAVRKTLLYHQLVGTRIEVARRYVEATEIAARVITELGEENVYTAPFGGSSWVGAVGFVNAALELAEQIKTGMLPTPDVIYIGCGTTGSVVGLAIGLQLANLQPRIEAIQVTPDSIEPAKILADLYTETIHELSTRDAAIPTLTPEPKQVILRRDQLGEGYAIPTPAGKEAAALMQQHAAMPSSLTYTAKAMAALIADARAGLLENKTVLFWNTYNSQPYPELPQDDSWKGLPEAVHFLFNNSEQD